MTMARVTGMSIERPATEAPGLAAAAPGPAADATLLQLIWLASPALPVGGFSYSEGLEGAIADDRAADEAGVARWLQDQLQLALARADLAVAAAAMPAWQAQDAARIQALNDWVRQTRETAEMRLQAEQMGRSLLVWLQQRWPDDPAVALLGQLRPAPTWPLALALATAHSGASLRQALLVQAFGWAENLVQAALKAVPLGQSAGQRILGQLSQAIPAAVDTALARAGDDDRQAFAPMLAIVSARHEAQYSRLFRS